MTGFIATQYTATAFLLVKNGLGTFNPLEKPHMSHHNVRHINSS
ncbi:hypothetical protein PI125_g25101 [Phytophthora idaei]|nr:hypothetical protein PI125_g25101 [Phytophthora idaei]